MTLRRDAPSSSGILSVAATNVLATFPSLVNFTRIRIISPTLTGMVGDRRMENSLIASMGRIALTNKMEKIVPLRTYSHPDIVFVAAPKKESPMTINTPPPYAGATHFRSSLECQLFFSFAIVLEQLRMFAIAQYIGKSYLRSMLDFRSAHRSI